MTTEGLQSNLRGLQEDFLSDSSKTKQKGQTQFGRIGNMSLKRDDSTSNRSKYSTSESVPRKYSENVSNGIDKLPLSSANATKKDSDEGHSDNSENSSNSRRFIKVKFGGQRDTEPLKHWEDDLNHIFLEDKSKFVGEFLTDNYKVMRGYINGVGTQLRLYYTKLEPLGRKIASLCIVHGFGEHSGRFINMADFFVQKGYVVHMIDLRGCGYNYQGFVLNDRHSGYPRSNASIEELHKDIEVLLRQANRDLPLFLFGHSMGGGLIASLLIRNPYLNISGVIFSSAMFQFHKQRKFSWKKKLFLKYLADDFEEIILNGNINPTALTTNNFQIKKLFDDKLCTNLVGMKLAKSLVDMTEWILPRASKFRYPCLIIHGKEDTVTDYEASIKFFYKISTDQKDVKIFEDGYHEIHHDNDKELMHKFMLEFLEKRMKANNLKNIGEFQPLKVGLKVKSIFERYSTVKWIILAAIYIFLLRQFRGHKLYNNKVKLFLYPIFYFINVLLKKHSWKVD